MTDFTSFSVTNFTGPSGSVALNATMAPMQMTTSRIGPTEGTRFDGLAGLEASDVFDQSELEQLNYRRFNPLALLTGPNLSNALDSFSCGVLMPAARLWTKIVERCETIGTVKSKREDSVALREWSVTKEEESPEAEDQQAVLEAFYKASSAGHALERHTIGGVSLLLSQMMESVAYKFAVHHLIWKPNAEQTITLPSGKTVPGLSAKFEQVPLEFFEARTGELRFLGMNLGYTGQKLAASNWLVTTGVGLMQCASTLYYLKRLATHDLTELSGNWSSPATVGHTTANKGSEQGKSMREAVKSVRANYAGVLYGANENKIEFLWPQGGGGSGNLPCEVIREDVKRELAALWLGSDLSTISRGGEHSVGASLQGDSQIDRTRADCVRISETLNAAIDPIVIRWYFGPNARILAKFKLSAPDKEDRQLLLQSSQAMANMGAPVAVEETAERLQVSLAKDGEATLRPSAAPMATAINAAPRRPEFKTQVVGKLLAHARDTWPESLAQDLAPLREALGNILRGSDSEVIANAQALYDRLPELGNGIITASAASDELEKILGTALANGLATSTGISA